MYIRANICIYAVLVGLICGGPKGYAQQEDLGNMILLKKGYTVNRFPHYTNDKVSTFSIADPGYSFVVTRGGCYLAGFANWLIQPQRQPIISIVQNKNDPDSTLLIVRLNLHTKKTLIQKLSQFNKVDSIHSLVDIPFGVYDLISANRDLIYLWGTNSEGSHVWMSNLQNLTPIFSSRAEINDIALVKGGLVLMAIDSSLVLTGQKYAPKELIKIDMKIESVAVDKDGTVYISTPKGVVHFNSTDQDDFDATTRSIHGKIRIYQNRLFVRWSEKNEIVEIKLR